LGRGELPNSPDVFLGLTVIKIAVCICTFRNPDGLRLLLDGIDNQKFTTILDEHVSIVVIDNDGDRSAADVLEQYRKAGRFNIEPKHEPKRGLSSARNAALDSSGVIASDFFAFVDDDEIPTPDWIQMLLNASADPERSIIVGPVEPVFDAPPPAWIVTGAFFSKRCNTGKYIHPGHTANVLIRTSILKTSAVRFDESLNLVGGEDVVFFHALRVQGYAVFCSPQAIVRERIPASRASLSWMRRRWLRAGATEALIRNYSSKGVRARSANISGGLLRIAGGGLLVVLRVITHGRKDFSAVARALSTVYRGAGMLMAAFGHSHQEYGSSYRASSQ
jgi:succinoglycan biosynthesis protein ExoM